MKKTILGMLMLLACAAAAPAAVFQYMIQIEPPAPPPATTPTSKPIRAPQPLPVWMWIPPQARQVRGVVICGMTLMEREFVKDPQVRAACAQQQLAIVFSRRGVGSDYQKILDPLAAASGYPEIVVAPLMFVGHSAGGPAAKGCAVAAGRRCFGLVQYRGGGPWGQEPVLAGIPTLMMVGQFDEFGGAMRDENGRERAWEPAGDELSGFRSSDERNLTSMVVEPGAGHFAWSERNGVYLAKWIAKAAQASIPDWPVNAREPVQCKLVDHKSGWLTDPRLRAEKQQAPAAYEKYAGEKDKANWHFDQEMAEATVAYHAGIGRKDQFIKWKDPYWVDAGTRYFFASLEWVGDGQSFRVHPVYAQTYPTTRPQAPRWHLAGQPVGHSTAPILVKQVSGPVVAIGPDTLRMEFDGLSGIGDLGRVTFMAYSVGDEQYRYTEQVGMMPRGFGGLKAGKEQTITFPPLGNLKADGEPLELKATSDSGLKVEYYVNYGPAVVEAGKLKVAELPLRANFPIEVSVTACQFGSGVAPLVKTASPVTQIIRIEKP